MEDREVVEALNSAISLGLSSGDSDAILEIVSEYFVRDRDEEVEYEDDESEDEYWFDDDTDDGGAIKNDLVNGQEDVTEEKDEDEDDATEPPIAVDFTPADGDVLANITRYVKVGLGLGLNLQ